MAPPSTRRPRPFRKFLVLLLTLVGVWLVYNLVRYRLLLRNAHTIAAHSARFPRDYFVGEKDKPVLTYLVMGDSTAAGWGAATLQGTYPYLVAQEVASRGYRVHVQNVAVGGATIWDVCRKQLPRLPKVRPDMVTLSVGANDSTRGTTDGDCIRGYRTLFEAFRQSSVRTVLVADVPDMSLVPALPWPLSPKVDARAQRVNVALWSEAGRAKVRVVDLYAKGKLAYRRDPALYASDLFHPSSKGYGVWAKIFIEALRRK